MANVLLIILLIISIILIGLILIQRSEGGALGIGGGGGGGGGLMSGRGTADLVSRMTAVFGGAFLLVCLLISIAFNVQQADTGLLDAQSAESELVTDTVGEQSEEQKTENPLLNEEANSGNDTTPLAEDSQSEESDAETQENPQND
ncbi:MAG: preprotein translocase subunit SecG [Robiginitomaculum sp.]|nr:MAG: preprotein translocase subunit SecG [Robiginitomaculum sp.]